MLRDRLEAGVLARIPFARVNGVGCSARVKYQQPAIRRSRCRRLLERLDRAGFCASAGAACSAAGTQPSHV
jgi:cysteine desulfurase